MKYLAIFAAVFGLSVCARAQDASLSDAANRAFLAANAHKAGTVVRGDGLQYTVIQAGAGNTPAPTDQVDVVYSGALINGKVFDHSDPGSPASFRVYELIPGWTEALTLMRPGAVWQVVIPADLAYGAKGTPDGAVPPGQTLVFALKLVAIHRAAD
ncbi:MAG: FKBP-type peptidyl-prolyl cis-trans isomerase [Rhizomicrobium sp.]|jgi:FKBP-type peptidyl-prolyl cis-trans isomerase